MSRVLLAVIVLITACCSFSAAQVRYTITLASPEKHLVQVSVQIPPGRAEHELQLPVWNALYQIRDFSQYMQWIRAYDSTGRQLPIIELNASRWKISGARNGAKIEYEMFSSDSGSFGAELNSQHAFLNLAELLVYAEDQRQNSGTVEFRDVPAGWKIATPLHQEAGLYKAKNYDVLVDSPFEVGTFSESDFHATCGNYRVIVDAADAPAALAKIVPPLKQIVAAATSWMNGCPFGTYTFIYHFSDSLGRGGMEHAYGTAITMPARALNGDMSALLSVTAHEFFHLWNVKRIRPQSLEPIDYTKENYTSALWFSEGVDSSVGDYILLRAGLLDEPRFLAHLGEAITELEERPGHLTQSAEQASLDAWLEKYPYYGEPERSISYYNKGELLGILLDLRMRQASVDKTSLQILFRYMYEHYAKRGKFFADSDGVRESAETVSGANLQSFFANYVSGVREIPWDQFFSYVGLHVTEKEISSIDPGFDAVQKFDRPPVVVRIDAGSGAERAGLLPGDILIQINGHDIGRDFMKDIQSVVLGGTLELSVQRDGIRQSLQWIVGEHKQRRFELHDIPNVTAEQKRHRAMWLFDGAVQAQ